MFQGREVIELRTHAKAKKRLTMRSRCIQKTLTPHSCGLFGDIYTALQVGAKTNEHCGNPWNCVGFIMHEGKLVWSSEWAKLFGLSPFWLLRLIFSCRHFSILLVQLSIKLVKKKPSDYVVFHANMHHHAKYNTYANMGLFKVPSGRLSVRFSM